MSELAQHKRGGGHSSSRDLRTIIANAMADEMLSGARPCGLDAMWCAMKSGVAWLLILLTIHAPVPCPDLDGECRGTPIESLAEMQAWHVLMLGIRPNDDIDRGPIRQDGQTPCTPDETPLGKLAVVSVAVSHSASAVAVWDVEPIRSVHLSLLVVDLNLSGIMPVGWRPPIATLSSRRLSWLCVWRV